MVGMRVCRAWEELGMKGRTISGSVGAFFTLLNMSEYVQASLYIHTIHQQACTISICVVDHGRSSSAIFLVEAVSSKTSMQIMGGYEGQGLSNINLWE